MKITVDEIRGTCTCGHDVGDYFELKSGQLSIPAGRSFCVYAVQSTLPLLPAKQRRLHPADWMATDTRIICPDPLCGVVMRVEQTSRAPRAPRRRERGSADISGTLDRC